MKEIVTRKIIKKRYIKLKEDHNDIARSLGVTGCAVRKAVRKFGFEVRKNKTGPKRQNLIGKTFNNYKVISFNSVDKFNRCLWLCECNCGNRKILSSQTLKQKNTKHCRKCYIYETGKTRELKRFGEIHCNYISAIKRKAKFRKLEFELTGDYLWSLFQEQNRKCIYSGRALSFAESYPDDCLEQTASLDRIDSTKGYIIGNVQWVHKSVNFMKQSLREVDFLNFCLEICRNRFNFDRTT